MTKEDSVPGLLSKMVKLVRYSATSWSDLDNKDTDRNEALNKQVLKNMIERKRRNDFARKREFDMLRKMRKREAMVGQDPDARPSFFQSSMPSKPDDRAQTLKKIDEIEAQMSMQWWQTKRRAPLAPGGDATLPPPARHPAATRSSGMTSSMPTAYASTLVGSQRGTADSAIPKTSASAQQKSLLAGTPSGGGGCGKLTFGFGATNYMAVDVEELAHDAEFKEAAMRLTSSDDSGAEMVSPEMLLPSDFRFDNPETWTALFDLYRVTNQKDKFENTAVDFVQRFDRSAPQWFSMLDMARQLVSAEAKAPANNAAANWICPSTIGIQTVAAPMGALAKASTPRCLDWRKLKAIEAAAVEPPSKIFSNCFGQPVQLRFTGDAHLHGVLQNATLSGQREEAQEGWLLRMDTLHVTHQPDEFELSAPDF